MDKQALDFNEIEGQLELVIKHLEKKEKKKAVHYHFNESTIERIKSCAQQFHMKESQFVEEVIVKLLDQLEAREHTPQVRQKKTGFSKRQVTPWGRLTEQIEKTKSVEPEPDGDKLSNDSSLEQVSAQMTNIELLPAQAATTEQFEQASIKVPEPAIQVPEQVTEHASKQAADVEYKIEQQELDRLQRELTDFIFYNFKPDYRILYQRFEKQVQAGLNISANVLAELITRLSKSGEITFYSHQNLLDINKKIFEDRVPEDYHNANFFDDDEILDD